MEEMHWRREPALDGWSAKTAVGVYHAHRTWLDQSKLYLDAEELGAFQSHTEAKEAAKLDYRRRTPPHPIKDTTK
jgi:hypothetical protein